MGDQQLEEMLQKTVDIAHWAAHTANEEILMSVIERLQSMGYEIKKDVNLFKRLEFFQSIKCTMSLRYQDPDSFVRLLMTFDKLMEQHTKTLE